MKELYAKIFKGHLLVTHNESTELWAEFGIAVYDKYLRKEFELQRENSQLKQDLKFVGQYIPEKKKAILSSRLKEQI